MIKGLARAVHEGNEVGIWPAADCLLLTVRAGENA